MNLIEDAWLPVIRENGSDKIAPWQIVERENPVLEMAAPRPDFQGALYQFMIGLLQTCFAPNDNDEWLEYWDEMPTVEGLKEKFAQVTSAFELVNPDGPLFMQEFNDFEGVELPIEDLIGGSISDATRSKNTDLFTKRGTVSIVSPYWAAIALFNVQTTGVLAWGQHRIGLRGNGPITSLVLPTKQDATLWRKLWLNVLSVEDFNTVPGGERLPEKKYIFPWLTDTRLSPGKKPTVPTDGNALQHYWPMPRRIRLFVEEVDAKCDMSGEAISKGVRKYKRIKDGVYYTGGWMHPLTPHFRKERLSFASPVVGTHLADDYRDWSVLTLNGKLSGNKSQYAKSVSVFISERSIDLNDRGRLWCFGYVAESANVKCWYEATFPFLSNEKTASNMQSWSGELIEAAENVAEIIANQVKFAWISKEKLKSLKTPIQKKTLKKYFNRVQQTFWSQSENTFYALLERLSKLPADQRRAPPEIYKTWEHTIRKLALELFDSWALEAPAEDLDMKRIIGARKELEKKLRTTESIKKLLDKSKP